MSPVPASPLAAPFLPARALLAAALGLAALGASACTPVRAHQGYVLDVDLVNSVQPGVDNRDSVLKVLGRPSLTSQFNEGEWYYVARDTRNLAFNRPDPVAQTTLRIRFDEAGTVTAIDRLGLEQVASINPTNDKTPTLGRERGFFQDLFGNIGTVGAPGAAGAPPQ
ncbi:outer membrane protein assembly factor BamE [Sphingomonas japonica]|uniref:Outer membrane protein assembly factor BamE (Lipoprotein component of BamABCDE complex) n=1 Tax=Sphingomonas japonica TaxID=511662 RepID=A0ABX0U2I6_9SPHN|nr:outer membrane protein assembly factor BamE [Sphingomonas japonica]NIJ23929.1 outer membrane protein assembly factor BamE (lipoprotein component of BamABCDE complex) [Sphingomonas japonica]